MYKIRIYTNAWHEIQNNSLKVLNPVLKEKLNGCGSLTYSVPVGDTYYSDYERFKTKVEVSEDGAILFVGRLLETNKDFINTLTLIFEGEMAYLNDVQYPPYEFSGTISDLFTNVLAYYNSKCSPNNTITRGNITVTDKNNYIARSDSNYSSCWSVLTKKLVELCGGYLCMRWVITEGQSYRYLDYLQDAGVTSTQKIEYGENIIGLTQELKGDGIITQIIPFGAKDETTGEKIDITSVNPTGKNYITSTNSSIYGIIEEIVEWEDVTLPQNLYNKAVAYLAEHDTSGMTIKVNAIDLHAVDVDIARLDVGDKVEVKSTPHGINTTMLINERERNLNDVSKDTITLGTEEKTLTSSIDSSSMNKEAQIDEDVVKSLARQQTDILLGGSGGYFEMLFDEDDTTKPIGFRIMDTMSEATAENVLLVNKNGIGFSNTGASGTYYNAWTIDGRLSANAIATGVLQDSQGNFVLDLDTGTITVGRLTLNTPDLIFGDPENQYIEVTTTSDNKGVLFDGTGEIKMETEGALTLQNNSGDTSYNTMLMTMSSTIQTGNKIYFDNRNINALTANELVMASDNYFSPSYSLCNYARIANKCQPYPSRVANYFNMTSVSDDTTYVTSSQRASNGIELFNCKQSNGSTANSLSLTSKEKINSFNAINYSAGSYYSCNQLSMSCEVLTSYSYNTAFLSNNKVNSSQLANKIAMSAYSFSSGSSNTGLYLTNYRYNSNNAANFIELNSYSNGRNSISIANRQTWTEGTSTYENSLNSVTLDATSDQNTVQIINRPLNNPNTNGNAIKTFATSLDTNGYRDIQLINYNNNDSTAKSNEFRMYKKETSNFISMSCYSKGDETAGIYMGAFDNMVIRTKDRDGYPHGIYILTLDSSGAYKDAIVINGRTLYFSGGYVRYS